MLCCFYRQSLTTTYCNQDVFSTCMSLYCKHQYFHFIWFILLMKLNLQNAHPLLGEMQLEKFSQPTLNLLFTDGFWLLRFRSRHTIHKFKRMNKNKGLVPRVWCHLLYDVQDMRQMQFSIYNICFCNWPVEILYCHSVVSG